MNANDDLDLRLRGWMRQRPALAPRGDLVDGAMARAATVRQRPAILAPSGEGAGILPVAGLVGGRRAILLLGALLLLLAMAFAFVGSRPPADEGRLLVSVGSAFTFVEPDGSVRSTSLALANADLSGDGCPDVIPGTAVVAHRVRFAEGRNGSSVELSEVGDARAEFEWISLNFGGTEFLSPDRRRLVLLATDVAVTVVDLADPQRPVTHRFESPAPGTPGAGFAGAAVDADGRHLAVAVRRAGGIELELIDLATGERRSIGWVAAAEPVDGAMALSLGGSRLALAYVAASDPGATSTLIVDTASGATTAVPVDPAPFDLRRAAWSSDGRWLAIPTADQGLVAVSADGRRVVTLAPVAPDRFGWAADGSRLAFVDDGEMLVTIAPDGSHRVERAIGPAGFAWSRVGRDLVVATNLGPAGIVVERYGADDVAPLERLALIPATSDQTATGPSPCIEWASTPVEP
jgi:hypothetical protein